MIGEIEPALHSLFRSLKRGRLHHFLIGRARVDADQAGLAVLYVLSAADARMRLTDLADQLQIDAPAVTRKAQQLARLGLVSRTQDQVDARVNRVQLTTAGKRTISRFRAARRAWLAGLLANWPEAEQAEFARLLTRFAQQVHRQVEELNS